MDTISVVWSPGEQCTAPSAHDDRYHKAKVCSISRPMGQVIATVHYEGYSVKDREQIPVTKLRKVAVKKKQSADPGITS